MDSDEFYVDVEVAQTHIGKSLFSKGFIKQGTIIWEDKNDNLMLVTKEEILSWSDEQRKIFCDYSWQEDENLFKGTYILDQIEKDPSNFINHSCDPSSWFVTDQHIAARRDIYPGEQITIDYATTDNVFITIAECMCGSPNCRGAILPTDYQLASVQRAYQNHFRFYLLKRMLKEGIVDEERDWGVGIMFQLHKNVEVYRSLIHGRGLRASAPILAGTTVWQANEPVDDIWIEFSEDETNCLDPNFKHLVETFFEMAENGKHRGPKYAQSIERDASNFFNHSCNPNVWFEGNDRLVAMRDIAKGEELAYDYATAKRLIPSRVRCHCLQENCRHEFTYEDYKLQSLRQKYGDHWVSHWLKLMVDDQLLVSATT